MGNIGCMVSDTFKVVDRMQIQGNLSCLSYIQGSGGIASIFSTATISAVVAVVGIIFRMFGKRSVHKNMGNIMRCIC